MRFLVPLLAVAAVACASDSNGPGGNQQIAAVQITTSKATLRPGEQSQFTAIAVNLGGTEIETVSPTWNSAAPSVATVSPAGIVTGVAPGSTSVTATIGGITGSRVVTVLAPNAGGEVVTMPGFSFVPFQVTIKRGDQVFFEFPRVSHNVIFAKVAGVPVDIQETANRTVPLTFNTTGQFAYDCTIHPGMSGLVIVTP
jgi:plastocyanin